MKVRNTTYLRFICARIGAVGVPTSPGPVAMTDKASLGPDSV
jgi:hypothetical protein